MENSFILFCDLSGKIKWSRSSSLGETRIYADAQFSDYIVQGNRVDFLFPMERGIGYAQRDEQNKSPIPPNAKGEMQPVVTDLPSTFGQVIREEDHTDLVLRHWYGQAVLVHGVQELRQGKEHKRVFFISKLSLPR